MSPETEAETYYKGGMIRTSRKEEKNDNLTRPKSRLGLVETAVLATRQRYYTYVVQRERARSDRTACVARSIAGRSLDTLVLESLTRLARAHTMYY
jgi:hypothetical protein